VCTLVHSKRLLQTWLFGIYWSCFYTQISFKDFESHGFIQWYNHVLFHILLFRIFSILKLIMLLPTMGYWWQQLVGLWKKVWFDTYHGLGHPVGEPSSLWVPRTHMQTLTKTYVVFFWGLWLYDNNGWSHDWMKPTHLLSNISAY